MNELKRRETQTKKFEIKIKIESDSAWPIQREVKREGASGLEQRTVAEE